jgi:hypothetical protein
MNLAYQLRAGAIERAIFAARARPLVSCMRATRQ